MQEQGVVSDCLLDELFEQKQLGTADNRVDALLEGLKWRKRLEGITEEDYRGVTALVHWHDLQRLQGKVLAQVVRCEQFLNDHDLIMDLAETNQKVGVGRRGVDLVAEFRQPLLGGFQPFRGREGQQGRLIVCADEIELGGHSLFEFEGGGGRRRS